MRTAEAAGEVFNRALVYTAVGELSSAKGDLHAAISVLERGLVLCQSVLIFFPWTASNLGSAYRVDSERYNMS